MPSSASTLTLCLALTPLACGGDARDPDDVVEAIETVGGEEARRAVVASIAERVILPRYRDFAALAADLTAAVEGLEGAEGAGEDAADPSAARTSWASAMDVWQEAELFQLGPAGAMSSVAGGQDLRARIYSWPLTSPCRVDQETLEADLLAPGALATAPANVRGLAALEYLLFAPDTANACPASSAINASGAWAALSPEEVRLRRARYAAAVARDLEASAIALRDAWEPSGGDFLGELVGAADRSTYASVQAALNAVSDALYYLDKETKDMKLAGPLGIAGCASETCPNLVESRYAKRSAAHIVRNIVAFQHAFHGGAPGGGELGFDDLLVAAGADALAADFADKIAAALEAAQAYGDPLEDAIAQDKATVEAAYTAIAELNRLMKTQLLSVLDLELPERAEGDND